MSDPIRDLKHELLRAAERQHSPGAARAWSRRSRAQSGTVRLLLATATLLIAATVALLFTAPWSKAPTFLARADAALTPPAGKILHEKWQLTSISTDPACTVRHKPSEIWIDRTPPHRYRALITDLLAYACSPGAGVATELGGTFDSGPTLRFVPPNTLSTEPMQFVFWVDSAKEFRDAITAGTAHDEGKTKLHGRTVERIRIEPPTACSVPNYCARKPVYMYVDPETFYPVEQDCADCGFMPVPDGRLVRLRMVTHYLTFEYLPRTDANLALVNIRAQHPKATITP